MKLGKGVKIELHLSDEAYADLCKVAADLGLGDVREAALIGVTRWVAARKAERDNRDPAERYFVNEALDELSARQKKL
jgi:hypothetical protein